VSDAPGSDGKSLLEVFGCQDFTCRAVVIAEISAADCTFFETGPSPPRWNGDFHRPSTKHTCNTMILSYCLYSVRNGLSPCEQPLLAQSGRSL